MAEQYGDIHKKDPLYVGIKSHFKLQMHRLTAILNVAVQLRHQEDKEEEDSDQ